MAGQIIAGGKYATAYTLTNSTSPTCGSSAVLSLSDQISTDVAIDDSTGAWTVTIDNVEDDPTLNTFIETYKDYAIAGLESLLLEDGTSQLANSSKTLLLIVKGGLTAGLTTNVQKSVAVPCVLALGAGGYKQEGSKYNRPKLIFKSVPILGSLAIGTTLFSGVLVTPVAGTLGTSTKYGRVFFG